MAVLFDILEAVQTQIQGLSLTGISNSNIQLAQVLNQRESVFPGLPGVLIVPLGPETIPSTAGTNMRDDIGYPIGVALLDFTRQDTGTGVPSTADTGSADQDYNFSNKLQWRENIRRKFFHQRLSGVSAVWTCHIEPMPIVDTVEWINRGGIWISMVVLRFWTREPRTIS